MLRAVFKDIDFIAELTDIFKLFFSDKEFDISDKEFDLSSTEFELSDESLSFKDAGLFLFEKHTHAKCLKSERDLLPPCFLFGRMNLSDGDGPSYLLGLWYGKREDIYRIGLNSGLPLRNDLPGRKAFKREVRRGVYLLLSGYTGKELPWGMLTGIRPAKIVHELLDEGMDKEAVMNRMTGYFMVSRRKSGLVYEVARTEKKILKTTRPDKVSLYIGIPFCATRCLYCSFASTTTGRNPGLLRVYTDALKREMELTANLLSEKGLKLQSIYIGGGTPTVLDAGELRVLLDFIGGRFDLGGLQEYTIEAGRPDSIDREKLLIIRDSSANLINRISINPQTMNDETLKLIGRNHSSSDVFKAFELAREIGFDNINMDIIMGLPGENVDSFTYTLRQIGLMCPESLTVHALAVKRASGLAAGNGSPIRICDEEAEAMMGLAQDYAEKMGLHPYYLYRQKNIAGNLENTGYCKPGRESFYNIQIMEEKQSIIAVGAGAVTKIVYPAEDRIERAFNVKNVEEYISRTEEMFDRKKRLLAGVDF